jgi:hypothetical protein
VPHKKALRQCASYALELLSHGGFRSHVIGALVSNGFIELLYFDHSVIVTSTPMHFLHDHGRFLAMLMGISSLTRRQWGHSKLLQPPNDPHNALPSSDSPSNRSKALFHGYTLDIGQSLILGNIVYQQHGIIGRGTLVVQAELAKHEADAPVHGPLKDQSMIVKISWPPATRDPEYLIIRSACQKASEMLEDVWVLDHLPNLLQAETLRNDPDGPLEKIRQMLGSELCEERVPRVLVQEELWPITDLTTAASLSNALRGIFKCSCFALAFSLSCG